MTRRALWSAVAVLSVVPVVFTLAVRLMGGPRALAMATARPAVPSAPPAAPPAARPSSDPPAPEAPEEFVGVIVAAQAVEIVARMDGRVDALPARVGDRVEEGAVLAAMDATLLKAELRVRRAGVRAVKAEAGRARVAYRDAEQRLARRRAAAVKAADVISPEELSSAEHASDEAGWMLQAQGAQVSERRSEIALLRQRIADALLRAPFGGVVAARYVDEGATVRADTPLLRLVSAAPPRVRFAVGEDALASLPPGRPLRCHVEGAEAVLEARVATVAPEVDDAARLVFVEAELALPDSRASDALIGRIVRVRRASSPPPSSGEPSHAAP